MGRTSNKREEILRFLTQFVAENGYAPSVREICAAVGLQSTATVHYHLGALREAGLIEMDDMKKRAITLPDAHRADRIPGRRRRDGRRADFGGREYRGLYPVGGRGRMLRACLLYTSPSPRD